MFALERRKILREEIAVMHNSLACGYYAIINLWKVFGLEPPSFEAMFEMQSANIARHPNAFIGRSPYELTMPDVLGLVSDFNFPALCTMAALPRFMSPRDTLPPLIEAGAGMIVGYRWKHGGRERGHVVTRGRL